MNGKSASRYRFNASRDTVLATARRGHVWHARDRGRNILVVRHTPLVFVVDRDWVHSDGYFHRGLAKRTRANRVAPRPSALTLVTPTYTQPQAPSVWSRMMTRWLPVSHVVNAATYLAVGSTNNATDVSTALFAAVTIGLGSVTAWRLYLAQRVG